MNVTVRGGRLATSRWCMFSTHKWVILAAAVCTILEAWHTRSLQHAARLLQFMRIRGLIIYIPCLRGPESGYEAEKQKLIDEGSCKSGLEATATGKGASRHPHLRLQQHYLNRQRVKDVFSWLKSFPSTCADICAQSWTRHSVLVLQAMPWLPTNWNHRRRLNWWAITGRWRVAVGAEKGGHQTREDKLLVYEALSCWCMRP